MFLPSSATVPVLLTHFLHKGSTGNLQEKPAFHQLVMGECWRHFPVLIEAMSFEAAAPTMCKSRVPPFDAT